MSISRSALAAALLTGAIAFVPAAAQAAPKQHSKQTCKQSKQKKCHPGKPGTTPLQGRMTGHGHQFDVQGFDKVQWEFRNSVCNENRFPDLKVEYGRNKFILDAYLPDPLQCLQLFPPRGEENPVANFDTIRGQGPGRLNGKPATIKFQFSDLGEPGRDDLAEFTIMQGSTIVFQYTGGAVDGGNHQAHRR